MCEFSSGSLLSFPVMQSAASFHRFSSYHLLLGRVRYEASDLCMGAQQLECVELVCQHFVTLRPVARTVARPADCCDVRSSQQKLFAEPSVQEAVVL